MTHIILGFPGSSLVKNPSANAGEAGLIPASGRLPGGGNGNPLQYPCLGNSMDRVDGEARWMQSMGLQRVGWDLVTE